MRPANLRANKCRAGTRLRLCDLGGGKDDADAGNWGGAGGGAPASVESGGWGSRGSTFGGGKRTPSACRWEDLDASAGEQLVGSAALSLVEGDLVLLQDVSQPLKQLAASATEASMGGGDRGGGGGGGSGCATWSPSRRGGTVSGDTTDACDMSSIGSWYGGGASDTGGGGSAGSAGSGGGGGGGGGGSSSSAWPLTLPANKSSGSYSFKPKERALRIRTRRDRLEEGKIVAAAAAASAAAAVATAAAAAATAATVAATATATATAAGTVYESSPLVAPEGIVVATDVCDASPCTGSGGGSNGGAGGVGVGGSGGGGVGDGSGGGSGGLGSPGALSDETLVAEADSEALSSGEETVGASGACGVAQSHLRELGDRTGDATAATVAAGGGVEVAAATGEGGARQLDCVGQRQDLEDGSFEDLWGVPEEKDDAWGVCSSERDAYAGLGGAEGDDDAILMHSEAEVAEAGGSAQFEDLVAFTPTP